MMLKNYDGVRHGKGVEYRERVAGFQVRKKIILRKTGQDLFQTLREVEKETLGANPALAVWRAEQRPAGQLRACREPAGLLRRRPRRLPVRRALRHARQMGQGSHSRRHMLEVASGFLRSLYGEETSGETIDGWLCAPENARELVGTGTPDDSIGRGRVAAGAAGQVGAATGRREGDGARDRVVPRGSSAQRVCAAHQSATVEECADRPHGVRPRGAHDPGTRQTLARQPVYGGGEGGQLPGRGAGQGGGALPAGFPAISPRPAAAGNAQCGP